jgi:hypothetical protein
MHANLDTRYTFTAQFLVASAIFAKRTREMERSLGASATEATQAEHRGIVVAAIMQCAAALETEIHEISTHGPGAHLGSDHTDRQSQELLAPLADVIDDQEVLTRYEIVLHLLQRPPLVRGAEPFQSAALLIRLRNELVHYKSRWGKEMDGSKLLAALHSLKHQRPPFVSGDSNFFPHQCLSADCAAWAVRSAVAFIDAFYAQLDVPSRLDPYRSRIEA